MIYTQAHQNFCQTFKNSGTLVDNYLKIILKILLQELSL